MSTIIEEVADTATNEIDDDFTVHVSAIQRNTEAVVDTRIATITVASAPLVAVPALRFPRLYIIAQQASEGGGAPRFRAFNLEVVEPVIFDSWVMQLFKRHCTGDDSLAMMIAEVNRSRWDIADKWWALNYLAERGVHLPICDGEDAAALELARLERASRAKEEANVTPV